MMSKIRIPKPGSQLEVRRAFQQRENRNSILSYITTTVMAADDWIPVWDTSEDDNRKVAFSVFEAALSHDNLTSGTIADHDTSATGAELDTLTDMSNADSLHTHNHDSLVSGTIASHDTSATGAELGTLTDDSMADSLHRHSELSASDGSPDAAVKIGPTGNVAINGEPTDDRIYWLHEPTDLVNSHGIDGIFKPNTTTTAGNTAHGMAFTIVPGVASGQTNSNRVSGLYVLNTGRNTAPVLEGTLSLLLGIDLAYGMQSGTGTITTSVGLRLRPRHSTGTITSAYDIWIQPPLTGGTVTNDWSIYNQNTASSYFAGSIGLGTDPSYKLHLYDGSDNVNCCIQTAGATKSANMIFLTPARGWDMGTDGDDGYFTFRDRGDSFAKVFTIEPGAGAKAFHINSNGNIGFGTSGPDGDVEINSAAGGSLRLTYNDSDGSAANHADLTTDSNGGLQVTTTDGSGAAADIDIAPDGVVTIGDGGTTNYTKIEADGTIEFNGAATVWDDMRIMPGAFSFAGVGDPALADWQPGGSGATFKVYKFQKNKEVFATCQMSHAYMEGSDLHLHLHWTPCDRGAAEGAVKVGWKVDYSIANIDGTFGASITADLSDTCSGSDDKHEMTSDVQISGSGLTVSHMIMLRIYRSDTGTDDTWAGTTAAQSPALLEVDFHFEIDTVGSRQELVK